MRLQLENTCVLVRLLPDVSCLGCCHYCVLQSCTGLRAVADDAPLAAQHMDLEDCPLLPAGAVLPLQDPFSGQTLLHPETQQHLTLTDLSVSCCTGQHLCRVLGQGLGFSHAVLLHAASYDALLAAPVQRCAL